MQKIIGKGKERNDLKFGKGKEGILRKDQKKKKNKSTRTKKATQNGLPKMEDKEVGGGGSVT